MNYKKITYGILDKVLKHLKYKRVESHDKYRVYINKSFEAIIALPNLKNNEIVDDVHYFGVASNIIGKGIVKNSLNLEYIIDKVSNDKNALTISVKNKKSR